MIALFEFSDLSGGYGVIQIITEILDKVDAGDILAVFGRNGVGKTTLGRSLNGKLTALSGSITHAVSDVIAQKAVLQRKSGIGYMPQTRMVFDDPTARENLSLGDNQSTNDLYFDRFPCLEEHLA